VSERLPVAYSLDKARLKNPFLERLGKFDDPYEEFVDICVNNLPWATSQILRKNGKPLKLAPFQCVILEELWNRTFPILLCSRGASKTFMLAVYAIMRAIFQPGSKIVIVAASFRQSRLVFNYIEEFYEASPILQAATKYLSKPADSREIKIGDSVIMALPLGNGEKIRGVRATHILVDEYASIPEEIFQVVVRGFAAVSADPIASAEKIHVENELIKAGKMSANQRKRQMGNQIIYSGTASYQFNHFYKLFKIHEDIIGKKFIGDATAINDAYKLEEEGTFLEGEIDYRDYGIIRIPYDALPKGFMDEKQIAQARATMTRSLFSMEYCCEFPTDSDGFFKRSAINGATPSFFDSTEKPVSVEVKGEPGFQYVMGIDPARKSDNFAISVVKIVGNGIYHNVFCTSFNKKTWPDMVREVRAIMQRFNIVRICVDAGGGGTIVEDLLQDHSMLHPGEVPIWRIDDEEHRKLPGLHILEMVNFTPAWIAETNYGLAADIEHKRIKFPKRTVGGSAGSLEEEECWAEIDEQINEMCKIVITVTKTGVQHFDLPDIPDSPSAKGMLSNERKDRYSALLLSSYAARSFTMTSQRVVRPNFGRWA
jgi:hypothetical protein